MLFAEFSLSDSLLGNASSIWHTIVVGSLTYLGLIALLRISGKRTLSKWNAFDFSVTIALGSILASALLSTSTSLLQAVISIGLLVGCQFLITWISARSNSVENIVKAGPTLLLFKGEFIEEAMLAKRITKAEVLSAIRVNGHGCIEDIDAVVLENEGSFSVIKNLDIGTATAMRDVSGFRQASANLDLNIS